MFCSKCGTQVPDVASFCSSCGVSVREPAVAPDTTSKPPQAKDHDSYGIFTTVAVLLPGIALIMGIVKLLSAIPIDRKLGEHTLVFSILMMVLYSILWFAIFVFQPGA